MSQVHPSHDLINKYDGNNVEVRECRYCLLDLTHNAEELKSACESIYRVWSDHPKAHRPVARSVLDEETVQIVAENRPDIIYFFALNKDV